MIKFFRKIRQNLLSENKFSKYLIYAVGEIVLVVIGILIALSLNNWKESIDQKELEKNLYTDLIEELQIDLGEIQGNKAYNQRYLSRYKLGSEIIQNDIERKKVDTLAIIATELTKFSDFKSDGSAYQKLTISGKIDLISDNDILNALQNLGILYTYINRIEKNQTDFMYTVVPKITDFLRLNPLEVKKPSELYNYKFHNDIELIIGIGIEKHGLYQQAENDLTKLIKILKSKVK